jgi:predicted nucleotide-binding protein
MTNEYTPTGISLHLLKQIAKHRQSIKDGHLVRLIAGVFTRDQMDNALKTLAASGLLDQPTENEYIISSKGTEYLHAFDLTNSDLVFDHRYDIAVLKFLYEFGDPIHEDDFPSVIINGAPRSGNGSQEFQFTNHLEFGAGMKQYVQEHNRYWSLSTIGRAKCAHEFGPSIQTPKPIPHHPKTSPPKMPSKPLVFIGSSTESRKVAEAIVQNLDGDFEFKLWTLIFEPSDTTLDTLINNLRHENLDFAIILLTADDKVVSRNEEQMSPRDNVVFELGLAIGILGRQRVFMVRETSSEVKMPTDLSGINYVTFQRPDRTDLANKLIKACSQIRQKIEQIGLKNTP